MSQFSSVIAVAAAAALSAATPAYEPGLIIDNFAGGGGASTGIEAGMGRKIDIAINHDEAAIAVHRANHPDTEHHCQSVWDVLPAQVVKGRTVDLAWFSPDCKHFSKAKGGQPVEKKIRDLAWVVVRWAEALPDDQKPKVIMLENVEEFQDWGPLVETEKGWMPCLKRKGDEFRRWIRAMRRQGYKVKWREFRACDYRGNVHVARTKRNRLFMIMRRDGHPIVWPKPTHGDPKSLPVRSGKLLPWHTAAECIDWSLPCPSIFNRERPLKDATCRRIAAGIMRYVVNSAKPFVVPLTHHGSADRLVDLDEPAPTITAAHRGELAMVEPFLVPITHTHGGNTAHGAQEPLRTITTAKGGEFALCTPLLAPIIDSQYGRSTGAAVNDPMPTVTAGGAGKQALVSAVLTQYYGDKDGKPRASAPLDETLRTQTTENRFGLVQATLERAEMVAAFIAQHNGGFYEGAGNAADAPFSTIVGRGTQQQLAAAHLVKLRGTCADGQPIDEPAPTLTAGGMHVGEVRAFLTKYYGDESGAQDLRDPMHTARTKECFGLVTVTIAGEQYIIVDIGMRMLTPRELARAQGFPENYILDPLCHYRTESGAIKFGRLPKTHQIAKIGNSVCPAMAEVLTLANCWMYAANDNIRHNPYRERVAA